jgi:hypothetical protein
MSRVCTVKEGAMAGLVTAHSASEPCIAASAARTAVHLNLLDLTPHAWWVSWPPYRCLRT